MTHRRPLVVVLAVLLAACAACAADVPAPGLAEIAPAGIDGALLLCGSAGSSAEQRARFVELAGGHTARLVILPSVDHAVESESLLTLWRDSALQSIVVLDVRSRDDADNLSRLTALPSATAVWFAGDDDPAGIADVYRDTQLVKELRAVCQRRGVIGGHRSAIAVAALIANGDVAEPTQGFNLLPGTLVASPADADLPSDVAPFLAAAPGHVGLSLAARSALVVRGRRLQSVGESFVAVQLAPSPNRAALRRSLEPNDVADLTALRRAAVARAAPLFPPERLRDPVLAHGALLIVGGGGFTQEMVARFVELAGGDEARIVVVPTAEENPRLEDRGDVKRFRDAGAKEITVLHTTDRATAGSDEFLAPLRRATGIWFGGGRQWRFVDVYEGTAAYDAFHDVLRRGGIIGGSSAGATIQGEYLVRGHPLGNTEMMAEGYERGFAFLPAVAIDQHFTQRGRRPDMLALKRTFPQLLGLGIDESTALLVQGGTATVLGEHSVSFYDAPLDEDSDRPDHTLLTPGQSYNLRLLKRIED